MKNRIFATDVNVLIYTQTSKINGTLAQIKRTFRKLMSISWFLPIQVLFAIDWSL